MKVRNLLALLAGSGFAVASVPTLALDPISQQSGFSGYIQPGVGYMDIKSNMIAKVLSFDMSKDKINSLGSDPDSQSTALISFPFKLAYTFDGSQTEVFLGTEVGDLLSFDVSQQLGVKHNFGDIGVIQAGLLFSGPIVKVWKDPYVTGQDREDTSRESSGGQVAWDKVFGSDLELVAAFRHISIDTEDSGQFLGLTDAQQQLLDRNGNVYSLSAGYRFQSGPHIFKPEITGTYADLDGDAMASKGAGVQLTYLYLGDPVSVILNGSAGYADYDKRNPIFGKTRSDDTYGASASIYYRNPWDWRLFGSTPMQFYVTAAYLAVHSNIDFYEQEATIISTVVALRWK